MEATKAMVELQERADVTRALYERAGMTMPEPLKRFFGLIENGAKPAQRITVPPPERANRPSEAGRDWIWIGAESAHATSVLLAVLREFTDPVWPKELVEKVHKINPKISAGTLANIGTRLSGTLIHRGEEGWVLNKRDAAGVLYDGYLWGPPKIFNKHELAAYRRDAVLHLLRLNPRGLQTVQILDQLKNCEWIKAPVNKELIQDDVEVLFAENKIRRRGNTRKWEVAPNEKGGK